MNLDIPDPSGLVGFLVEVLDKHGDVLEEVGEARVTELEGRLFHLVPGRTTVSGPFDTFGDLLLRTGRVRTGAATWPKVVEWEGLVAVVAEDGSVHGPAETLEGILAEEGVAVFAHDLDVGSMAGSGTSGVSFLAGGYFAQLDGSGVVGECRPTLAEALEALEILGSHVIPGSSLRHALDDARGEALIRGFRVWESGDDSGEVVVLVNDRPMRFSKARPPVPEPEGVQGEGEAGV